MRLLCWRHGVLTLFSGCADCLRERAVHSLSQRRAEVADLRDKVAAVRRARSAQRENGGG